ncbi:hypothetical protein M9H77_07828 [Catharanthus roseus]|uniref:Uncharacterized protein n=1 Tax=Catharanthus roseus TaxID=4058 RepID=A0ACC0BWB7_CATRO|nr:hypothetical protein M9H77_07828 [Catharanthus roseus]
MLIEADSEKISKLQFASSSLNQISGMTNSNYLELNQIYQKYKEQDDGSVGGGSGMALQQWLSILLYQPSKLKDPYVPTF